MSAGRVDVHVGPKVYQGIYDYDVRPGEQCNNGIYRQSIDDLQKPIRIGTGAKVRGSLAGYQIQVESRVLIKGSVCGLSKVCIGERSRIYGDVVGEDVEIDEGCAIQGNIFARRLHLGSDVEIKGHVICRTLLDSRREQAFSLPRVRLGGVLLCDQNFALTRDSQIVGVISTGHVYVASLCSADVILAKGIVSLAERSFAYYVQCGGLIMGKRARVAFAYAKEWATLGDEVELGFFYCDGGIRRIGKGARFWGSTLVSWYQQPFVEGTLWLDQEEYCQTDALGIVSRGRVVGTPEGSSGALYTKWIDRELLAVIKELVGEELFLPFDAE